ncbi:hypothetical protein [Streptomyces sp. NPDC047985]|uniref:hypothetical protein n=1 Tax=Streptomyces sp. NPDC047985 TaxID=3155384 RepID=UPI0034303CF1
MHAARLPTTVTIPVAVIRHQCPHCRRTWAKQYAADLRAAVKNGDATVTPVAPAVGNTTPTQVQAISLADAVATALALALPANRSYAAGP